jgi:hypothetical protein
VRLGQSNRFGLRAFISAADLKNDLLAFIEHFVPVHVDGGIVDENVLPSTVDRDEAVAFFSVEPLDGSVRHVLLPMPCFFDAKQGHRRVETRSYSDKAL